MREIKVDLKYVKNTISIEDETKSIYSSEEEN